MPTLSTATRTALAVALLGEIDGAASAADFVLQTAASAVLATIALNDPSFTEAAGVLTLDVSPALTNTASGTGTAALWEIQDGDGTMVIEGDIGTGAEDLDIDNTSITTGQTINLNSMTITVPAS